MAMALVSAYKRALKNFVFLIPRENLVPASLGEKKKDCGLAAQIVLGQKAVSKKARKRPERPRSGPQLPGRILEWCSLVGPSAEMQLVCLSSGFPKSFTLF
jgi:hypothetical protein